MFRYWAAVYLCAFAVSALAFAAPIKQQPTQTTLIVDTREVSGHTQADIFVAVSGADGLGAPGSISLTDGTKVETGAKPASGERGGDKGATKP